MHTRMHVFAQIKGVSNFRCHKLEPGTGRMKQMPEMLSENIGICARQITMNTMWPLWNNYQHTITGQIIIEESKGREKKKKTSLTWTDKGNIWDKQQNHQQHLKWRSTTRQDWYPFIMVHSKYSLFTWLHSARVDLRIIIHKKKSIKEKQIDKEVICWNNYKGNVFNMPEKKKSRANSTIERITSY